MADSNSTNGRRDPPPYSMVEYIEIYDFRLYGRPFSPMGHMGDEKEIRDVPNRCILDTARGVWIKRWWNWDGCAVTDSMCHYPDTDSPFVGCSEEAGYEQCIGDILGHLQATPSTAWA